MNQPGTGESRLPKWVASSPGIVAAKLIVLALITGLVFIVSRSQWTTLAVGTAGLTIAFRLNAWPVLAAGAFWCISLLESDRWIGNEQLHLTDGLILMAGALVELGRGSLNRLLIFYTGSNGMNEVEASWKVVHKPGLSMAAFRTRAFSVVRLIAVRRALLRVGISQLMLHRVELLGAAGGLVAGTTALVLGSEPGGAFGWALTSGSVVAGVQSWPFLATAILVLLMTPLLRMVGAGDAAQGAAQFAFWLLTVGVLLELRSEIAHGKGVRGGGDGPGCSEERGWSSQQSSPQPSITRPPADWGPAAFADRDTALLPFGND